MFLYIIDIYAEFDGGMPGEWTGSDQSEESINYIDQSEPSII